MDPCLQADALRWPLCQADLTDEPQSSVPTEIRISDYNAKPFLH